MADRWFEIASIGHFWIRRRFEVLQVLCGGIVSGAAEMAEFGCGHGLLQRQVEDAYGREITGFDLNEYALQHNVSRRSRVCCYDILGRELALEEKFDVIFLFDVLEHIAEEDAFLQAVLFHLAPRGKVIVNVPAGEWAFSKYDTAAGHVRRYTIHTMRESAQRNRLEIQNWTYWGMPLVPALLARKLWLMGSRDPGEIITTGFDARASWINGALGALSRCEWIPQKVAGTSLMAILQTKE
jgi:SAM-dependent methyltransferase